MSHNATPEEQERILRTVLTRGSNASLSNPIPVIPVGATVVTEDSGLNTNPERYRQQHHWQTPRELVFLVAGAAGRQVTGDPVPAGEVRRIREITVRNATVVDTVVTLFYDVTVKLSFDVPAQSTRVWSSQDGRKIPSGSSSAFQVSAVNGGTVNISASGLEAAV